MQSVIKRGALRSLLVALAMLVTAALPAAPAQAAWAAQIPLTLQINAYYPSGGSQTLGRAEGWMQFDDGGNALRYSLTFCRQSSYIMPYMTISVNVYSAGGRWYRTHLATVYPSYTGHSNTQPCYSSTGTASGEHTYANFWNVEFLLHGSTFMGSSHEVFTQDRLLSNPY